MSTKSSRWASVEKTSTSSRARRDSHFGWGAEFHLVCFSCFFCSPLQTGTGYFSLDLLFVPCLWGILIPLLDLAFNHLAHRLTEWENWKLGSTFRALLIAKVFSFRFINAFLALYYYMFDGEEDGLVRLTTSVASFMLAGQLLRFMISVGGPYLSKRFNGWLAQRRAKQAPADEASSGTHAASISTPDAELSRAWLESTYPEYDHFEDYANMAIQFGYVCFFSVAFPFAPLCALVNNLIMVRVGAYKLCRLTRRPLACKASGLGVWLQVLQLMSVIAVLTNTAMIGLTSLQLSAWIPAVSVSTKILAIFAFEHVVLGVKVAIAYAIPDVTKEVEQQRRKEKIALNQANTEIIEIRRKQMSVEGRERGAERGARHSKRQTERQNEWCGKNGCGSERCEDDRG
jgi:anoctamin-8